jgi:UDP-N-acetylglucosamine--N-acetylmuramyl-(pentapeptide) pyrophosphoryl-undecaprenol N-acetylglucosamine transferase
VRSGFLSRDKELAKRTIGITGPLVVSFWGSLGARHMNEITAEFIKLNYEHPAFKHIHATGNGEEGLGLMRGMLEARGVSGESEKGIDLRPYIFDMPKVMSSADVVICRSGASTLSELTLIGKPAILIPSPYVTNNHQEKNAMVLERRGGAVVIREAECTAQALYDTTLGILNDPGRMDKMSSAMLELSAPGATDKITETVLELAQKSS